MRNIKPGAWLALMTTIGLLFSAAVLPTKAQNWEIVPGRSVGPITENTSEKQLIKLFGAQNVRRSAIDVGEGETQPGTILFPSDPRRRAYVLWRDAANREMPESISIRDKNTLWKTNRGITIGTTLKTLEQLNGGAFALTGFGWDYSGTVLHSNGGQLSELGTESDDGAPGRTLLLRLEPAAALQGSRDYNAVIGDGSFFSDNPAMRRLNPSVYEMIVNFEP